jgi:hypothetical protein
MGKILAITVENTNYLSVLCYADIQQSLNNQRP